MPNLKKMPDFENNAKFSKKEPNFNNKKFQNLEENMPNYQKITQTSKSVQFKKKLNIKNCTQI